VNPTLCKPEAHSGIELLEPLRFSQKHSTDLRQFIQTLDDEGRLVRVREIVDWKFEIGRMTRESRTPLLFENIQDYPGQRVFTNGLCDTPSIGLVLGLDLGASRKTLGHRALVTEAQERITTPIKPKLVENGPVRENILRGEAVDLLTLPVPHWNDRDVGRYIGTWHVNVTKDPETGARNVGIYRMQILDSTQATVSASPHSHLARHVAKSERDGQPLPMAVAIGVNEAVIMAAAAGYPEGIDEFELAGALQQEALELIPCETVNLEVPANSEIVIEGFIQPDVRVQDGPYFDYTGKTNTNLNAFVFHATRLMFRSNPIFRGASIGVPGAEDHQLFAFLAELNLVNFHGSSIKHAAQNFLLKRRCFRAFQFVGKVGATIRSAFALGA
jgi:UbiD family decarboxylase